MDGTGTSRRELVEGGEWGEAPPEESQGTSPHTQIRKQTHTTATHGFTAVTSHLNRPPLPSRRGGGCGASPCRHAPPRPAPLSAAHACDSTRTMATVILHSDTAADASPRPGTPAMPWNILPRPEMTRHAPPPYQAHQHAPTSRPASSLPASSHPAALRTRHVKSRARSKVPAQFSESTRHKMSQELCRLTNVAQQDTVTPDP